MRNTDTSILPKVVLLNIVYHQCLCALHSSIVPLFSWSAGDDSWVSARHVSAQIAYDHACTASAVLESALTHLPDANALPSFIGYAAYCGCAIQIPFLWSSEPRIRGRAKTNVRTNVKIIRILAKVWKFSALLVGSHVIRIFLVPTRRLNSVKHIADSRAVPVPKTRAKPHGAGERAQRSRPGETKCPQDRRSTRPCVDPRPQ